MSMTNLFEQGNVVSILYPSDLQTKVTADSINMENYHAMDVIFFKGVGTAADDPTITIQQCTDAALTGAKDLNVSEYYLKQGTLLSTTSIGGVFTKTTQTATNAWAFDATSAETQMICGIHIEADMLDVTGGFNWITINVADVGTNAQLGCIMAVLYPARYKDDSGGENPLV